MIKTLVSLIRQKECFKTVNGPISMTIRLILTKLTLISLKYGYKKESLNSWGKKMTLLAALLSACSTTTSRIVKSPMLKRCTST